ncbi:MAG: OsmC family protein [Ignavibacteriae bacterium]|nr:OsmC family protein [Ignavibacteriota bacterium]
MVPQHVTYQGGLRSKVVHTPSNTHIETDAPTDNFGKGERHSPTDLVASALATCMITTIAIKTRNEGYKLDGTEIHVEKHMSTDAPRRIVKLVAHFTLPKGIPNEKRAQLEEIGNTCPVIQSINPAIEVDAKYHYAD